jgi:hypothetical protein
VRLSDYFLREIAKFSHCFELRALGLFVSNRTVPHGTDRLGTNGSACVAAGLSVRF